MTNQHPERFWLVGAGAFVALGAIVSAALLTRPEPPTPATNDDKPFVAYNIDSQSASKSAPQQAKSTEQPAPEEPHHAPTSAHVEATKPDEQARQNLPSVMDNSKQAQPNIIKIKEDSSISVPPPAENIEHHAPQHDPVGPERWMAAPTPEEQELIDAQLSRGQELVQRELTRQQDTNKTHHAARAFVDRVVLACMDMEPQIDARARLMIHARVISKQGKGRILRPVIRAAVYAKSPTLHQCVTTWLTRGSFDAHGDADIEADFTVFLSSPR